MRVNSLRVSLENVSKRFITEWVFRNVNLQISSGEKIVILGANGSGKSTLLQAISTYQNISSGSVNYFIDNKKIDSSDHYKYISVAAPYMELIEDFTFTEIVEHQKEFKPFQNNLPTERIIELSGLDKKNGHKKIKLFSSGMKQRAKLTLAILSDAPLLLLDEPCSNLDNNATIWYQDLIKNFAFEKSIVVCFNNIHSECEFCKKQINIQDCKN